MQQFISTKHHDAEMIIAGLADGSLRYWRTDASGTRWFSSNQPIHAVPSGVAIHAQAVGDNDDQGIIICEPFATDDELDDLIAREAAGEIEQIGQDQFGRVFFVEVDDAE